MDEDGIAAQIDEILEALRDTPGKDLGRDVLEKELRKFLEYGVPFEHAKQTLVKKFGGTGGQNKPPSIPSGRYLWTCSQTSKASMSAAASSLLTPGTSK
jgi:hypothetical protein